MSRLLAGVVALTVVITTPVLAPSAASAQSGISVKQSGASVNPNTVPWWISNGVIGSQVTAADSPVTSFGVTSNGSAGICVNSDRITANLPGGPGRNQLCMGAQTSGPATISLQNQGAASPQALQFVINGVTNTFPTSSSPLAVALGGTGATTAAGAQTSLGLGTMATQNANAVAITGGTITGLPNPTNPPDAATKAYADGLAAGLTIIAPSRLATAAVLPNTPTYSNGASGVGATLTAGSNSALTVDSTVANLNDVILVNNQAAPAQNGIYTVTTAGGGVPWVLTRATYFNQTSNMTVGKYTFINGGTTNINTSWVLSATVTTVGTTAVVFNQFSSTNLSANSVTNADLAQMPANTVKCNPTGSTANAQDCNNFALKSAVSAQPPTVVGNLNPLSFINQSSDNVNAGSGFIEGLAVNYAFGGSSMQGGRASLLGQYQQTAATSASSTNRNYVAVQGTASTNSGDGGSAPTKAGGKGGYFGFAANVFANSPATNMLELSGGEVDTDIQTGASAAYVLGWSVVGNNSVQGSVLDAAYEVGGATISVYGPHVGWNYGFVFADINGFSPVNSNSTLFGGFFPTLGTQTIKHGIDLSAFTCSTDCFKSTGFSVDGAGNVSGHSFLISGTPWVVYGFTTVTGSSTANNPTPNTNGLTGEVTSLPYTVPVGKTLVITAYGVQAADAAGTVVNVPFIGGGGSLTNATALPSAAAQAGTAQITGTFSIPAGGIFNIAISNGQATGTFGWFASGTLQ